MGGAGGCFGTPQPSPIAPPPASTCRYQHHSKNNRFRATIRERGNALLPPPQSTPRQSLTRYRSFVRGGTPHTPTTPLGGCNRSWLGRSPLRFRRVVCGAVLPGSCSYGAGAPTRVRCSSARGRSLLPPLRLTRLHLRSVLPPLSLNRSPLAPCRSG